jgi:hypothetical protein
LLRTGRLCGSSFINERFKKHVRKVLEEEDYLDIEDILENEHGIMLQFEYFTKRIVDFTQNAYNFSVPGLRRNDAKGFMNGGFRVLK